MFSVSLLPATPLLSAPPAAPPTTAPTTAPATRPNAAELAAALDQLAADDFATREHAVAKLQTMLLDQTRRQTEIQELLFQLQQSLADQLKQLALVTDPEAQARAAGLLEIQRGVLHWTIEVMKTPPALRKSLLAWGLKYPAGNVLGKVYAQPRKLRLEGIKDLAKLDDEGASWTLAQLLSDHDAMIRAQTMASVWDRKVSPQVVASLWNRALTRISNSPDEQDNPQAQPPAAEIKIEFPGTNYSLTFSDPEDTDSADDSTLATALLIHLQSPEVSRRLTDLIHENFKDNQLRNPNINILWVQNVSNLLEKYDLKAAVPMLAALSESPNVSISSSEINNKQFFWSTRTVALGALLILTRQTPDDYKLARMHDASENGQPGWYWTVAAEADEKTAIKKFHTWWKTNYKNYGLTEKPGDLNLNDGQPNNDNEQNAATEPATAPAPPADPSSLPAPKPVLDNLPHPAPTVPVVSPHPIPPA